MGMNEGMNMRGTSPQGMSSGTGMQGYNQDMMSQMKERARALSRQANDYLNQPDLMNRLLSNKVVLAVGAAAALGLLTGQIRRRR